MEKFALYPFESDLPLVIMFTMCVPSKHFLLSRFLHHNELQSAIHETCSTLLATEHSPKYNMVPCFKFMVWLKA